MGQMIKYLGKEFGAQKQEMIGLYIYTYRYTKLRNDLFCFLQCFRNHWFFKRQIMVSVV